MRRANNLEGKKFGKLTVIEKAYLRNRSWHYKCRCQCGDETLVRSDNLTQYHTTSCGCQNFRTFKYLRDKTRANRIKFGCKSISI